MAENTGPIKVVEDATTVAAKAVEAQTKAQVAREKAASSSSERVIATADKAEEKAAELAAAAVSSLREAADVLAAVVPASIAAEAAVNVEIKELPIQNSTWFGEPLYTCTIDGYATPILGKMLDYLRNTHNIDASHQITPAPDDLTTKDGKRLVPIFDAYQNVTGYKEV